MCCFVLIHRNVKKRYRQTLLGPVWYLMGPIIKMGLISILLGTIAQLPSEGVPYPLFTYSALLPWQLFSNGITRSTSCFVSYVHIVSKIYFPRIILPVTEVSTALVDFCLSFVILVLMLFLYGYELSPRILLLPFFLMVTMSMAISFGLLFAALQARFRDVSNFVGYIIQIWMYATPVAYSETIILKRMPEHLHWLYQINPMNGVIQGFRWALLDIGRPPDWTWLASALISFVLLTATAAVFNRTEHSIVDLI